MSLVYLAFYAKTLLAVPRQPTSSGYLKDMPPRFGIVVPDSDRRKVPAAATFYSPWDMEVASVNFEAMCGHGAIAAALGTEVCRVMQYFERGRWVNVPMMEAALLQAGIRPWRMAGWHADTPGEVAVTILQFLGSWMAPGVPQGARCRYRHWVATREGYVWDCNSGQWQSRADWEREVMAELMPPRATGYEPFRTFYWKYRNA